MINTGHYLINRNIRQKQAKHWYQNMCEKNKQKLKECGKEYGKEYRKDLSGEDKQNKK